MNLQGTRLTAAFFVFFGLLLTVASTADAQKVRLRSQITPACTQARATAGWRFSDIYADGNIAVQGSYGCNGVFIYDLTNPDAPVLASVYNPGNNQQFLEAIVIGNRGYFGSGIGNGGVHIVDLTNPANPVLLGIVDSTRGSGHNIIHEMMVFDQGASRYLVENYNQLSASTKVIKFIDITNPANPVLKWDLNPTDTTWVHAFHIRGNKFYTSGWGGRIEIYDIGNLATTAPALLGTIVGNTTNHSTWTSEDGNYLYSCRETFDGDVRVYNVSNPAAPTLVKSIKAGDLGLNAVTPHNPVVMGNKLYVSWYQAGIQVFDITNPANPVRVGQYDTFPTTFAPTAEEKKALAENAPWDMMCASPSFQNAIPSSYDGNWAVFPFLGETKVLAGDLTYGLLVLDVSQATTAPKNVVSDFDGDGKTDYSVYTPSNGLWKVESSSNSAYSETLFGLSTDRIVTADYDGDGKSDRAVFRPSTGVWYILGSRDGFRAVQFGSNGDIPVEGDYDADGKADVAVFRPSNGAWYILQSTLGIRIQNWGTNGDVPFTGDFEGDGKPDLAVFRPSTGVWYVLQSSSNIAAIIQWGISTDKPVSADFDGDGKNDFAVYRPSEGNWYVLNSSNSSLSVTRFGIAEDTPIPADYDGDAKADVAVFRPSSSVWYRLGSSNGAFAARTFGSAADIPSPTSVQP